MIEEIENYLKKAGFITNSGFSDEDKNNIQIILNKYNNQSNHKKLYLELIKYVDIRYREYNLMPNLYDLKLIEIVFKDVFDKALELEQKYIKEEELLEDE